eukprot:2182530-Pyramimonas_sp.AAC.1
MSSLICATQHGSISQYPALLHCKMFRYRCSLRNLKRRCSTLVYDGVYCTSPLLLPPLPSMVFHLHSHPTPVMLEHTPLCDTLGCTSR